MGEWDLLKFVVELDLEGAQRLTILLESSRPTEVRHFLEHISSKLDLSVGEWEHVDYANLERQYSGSMFNVKFTYWLDLRPHAFYLQVIGEAGQLLYEVFHGPQKHGGGRDKHRYYLLDKDLFYDLAIEARKREWQPFETEGQFIRVQPNPQSPER